VVIYSGKIRVKGHVRILQDDKVIFDSDNAIFQEFLDYLASFFYQVTNLPAYYVVNLSPTSIVQQMSISQINYNLQAGVVGGQQLLTVVLQSGSISVSGSIETLVLQMYTITGTVIPVASISANVQATTGSSIVIQWTIQFISSTTTPAIINSQFVQALIANAVIPGAPNVNSTWNIPLNNVASISFANVGIEELQFNVTASGNSYAVSFVGVITQQATQISTATISLSGTTLATINIPLQPYNVGTLVTLGFQITFTGE
jgi:hypothetical protein